MCGLPGIHGFQQLSTPDVFSSVSATTQPFEPKGQGEEAGSRSQAAEKKDAGESVMLNKRPTSAGVDV
jgi:hypothetical protein